MKLYPSILSVLLLACSGGDPSSTGGNTETDTAAGDSTSANSSSSDEMTGVEESSSGSDGLPATSDDDDDDDDDNDDDDTGPTPCAGDDDCSDGVKLFCVDEVCVDCSATADGDASCAALDPSRPACNIDSGACAQCTSANALECDGTTPICDTPSSECRGCRQHNECESGACRIPLSFGNDPNWGACFENVIAGIASSEVQAAFDALDNATELAVIISDDEGGTSAPVNIEINGNIDIAIIGEAGQLPVFRHQTDAARLELSNNAAAWLSNIRISGFGAQSTAGITVDGSQLHLQRTRIVQNSGGGIALTNSARAVIENSFVGGNISDYPAVAVDTNARVEVLYSTLYVSDFTNVLSCSSVADEVVVRNSLIAARGVFDEIACDAATLSVTYTATASPAAAPFPGEGNVGVGEFPQLAPEEWFVDVNNDFSLQNEGASLMQDVALWVAGDPATDITGVTQRPSREGPDYAGAHIPG